MGLCSTLPPFSPSSPSTPSFFSRLESLLGSFFLSRLLLLLLSARHSRIPLPPSLPLLVDAANNGTGLFARSRTLNLDCYAQGGETSRCWLDAARCTAGCEREEDGACSVEEDGEGRYDGGEERRWSTAAAKKKSERSVVAAARRGQSPATTRGRSWMSRWSFVRGASPGDLLVGLEGFEGVLGDLVHVEGLERRERPLHVRQSEHFDVVGRHHEGALARLLGVDGDGDVRGLQSFLEL
mmetsp:Transcript_8184/g.25268  ORF Transcript_8184/g.25268 Transcript_8184/m.25268 type:complete len:239 (+) Transcript_8184:637-1353(+)